MTIETQLKLGCCGLVLVLCVLGAALSTWALYLGLSGEREQKIHIYQEVIDAWEDTYFDMFDDIDVKVEGVTTSFSKVTLNHGDDILDHDYFGLLPTYDALYYKMS